jgi:hypothetical protein
MEGPRATRLVERALRCYPARWRRRHGDEAAELAALLIRDGASAGSIALSYLIGAVREWLTPRPGQRLSTAACALLIAVCSLSVSVVVVASPAPARAASTGQERGHPHCRSALEGPVPDVIRAMGQVPVIVWKAGHDRSC